MADSFATRSTLAVNGKSYTYSSLAKLGERFDIARLPYSMKILLENLLRHEDGGMTVGKEHIEAVANWNPAVEPSTEIAFMPARVVLQDFTGVPCVVDLAAMRDAVVKLGGKASQAGKKGVQPRGIHPARQPQPQGKSHRACPTGGKVAHIDSQRLVARFCRGKVRAAKVHVFQKHVAAHSQRARTLEHGAVVATAQQQGWPGLRKMPAQTCQYAVFRKCALCALWGGGVGRGHVSSPESDIRSV